MLPNLKTELGPTNEQREIARFLNLHPDPEIGGWPLDLIDRIVAAKKMATREQFHELIYRVLQRMDEMTRCDGQS